MIRDSAAVHVNEPRSAPCVADLIQPPVNRSSRFSQPDRNFADPDAVESHLGDHPQSSVELEVLGLAAISVAIWLGAFHNKVFDLKLYLARSFHSLIDGLKTIEQCARQPPISSFIRQVPGDGFEYVVSLFEPKLKVVFLFADGPGRARNTRLPVAHATARSADRACCGSPNRDR